MSALRPYQEAALDAGRRHLQSGTRRVLFVAPTGAGKTVLFSRIARGHLDRGGQVLIIIHRAELGDQAVAKLQRDGVADVGVIIAGRPRNPGARVQVASIGTLVAMRKRGEDLPPATLVIFDEAHHFVADAWGEVARQYEGAIIIGVTATPERGDGSPLVDLFDVLVPVSSVPELTMMGFLVPCEVLTSSERRTLAQSPVEAYNAHAAGRPAVVFLDRVAESKAVAESFAAAGIPAAHVDGETPPEERRDILDRFERGELRVLCNVFVLTEGWDCPSVEVCIIARSFTHAGTYLQAVGRVLRPSPDTGKTSALVLDLRGVARKHGLPDAERVYSLDGRAIGLAPTKRCLDCAAEVPIAASECPECGFRFPRGLGAELGLLEPKEALRRLTHDQVERAVWDDLVATARRRGFRAGWCIHKFEGRFGRKPWKFWRESFGSRRAA